jgi:hypothetical protein
MRRHDKLLLDKINPIFIALTTTSIHHCLLAWKSGEFRVSPEFSPGGAAQHNWVTRNVNDKVNNACKDVFHRLNMEFCSSSPHDQAKQLGNIGSMVRHRIHSTGTEHVMAQPHHNQGSIDEDFAEIPSEALTE